MMKDALVECIKNNYYGLYRMIAGYLPDQIEIESAGNVRNIYKKEDVEYSAEEQSKYRHSMLHIPKKEVPLFCIMLKINPTEDDFTFTLSPKEFYELFASYFTKLLADLDNIFDLESRFLPRYENYQIIKGKIKITQLPIARPSPIEIREGIYIDDENLWVWELFDRFKKDLSAITDPLFTYLGKYSQYKEFLLLDLQKELEKVEKDENKDIREIKEEIEVNRKREKEIRKEIIEKIQVGMFEIETKEICDYMSNKYNRIAQGLIKVISKRVIKSTVEQLEGFRDIENKIKKNTLNIEEASELKDYLDAPVVAEIEKMKVEVNRNAEVYILMEDYMFRFEPQ